MNRIKLFAGASLCALVAAGAAAAGPPVGSFPVQAPKPAKVLYNQNSNYAGGGINSQTYEASFSQYDDQGADDFVVPGHATWTITEVDVSGQYYNGSGPATSEDVIFYTDSNGMPGATVATFSNVKGTDKNGAFSITLPGKGAKLKKGKYWVSVIANLNYTQGGEWNWDTNSVLHGDPAMWRTQGGQWSAPNGAGPDLMFALRGTAKRD